MPVGDCQVAFGRSARRDGVLIQPGTISHVSNAGHLALPPEAPSREVLRAIFERLGGDEKELQNARGTLLQIDFIAPQTKLLIEIDEQQHFTSDRLVSLQLYPPDAEVAFRVADYIALCEVLRSGSDRYRADKVALAFRRPGGRRAQRAYLDAVRDLGAPLSGWRVFRVAAAHGDGARAYAEVRSRLRALL